MRTAVNEAMNHFVEQASSNGLFLIDSPTASGKTFSSGRFIYDQYVADPERKIFYITTRKSNIKGAYGETQKAFEEHGEKEKFLSASIVLKSNFDFVIDKLGDEFFLEKLKNGSCKKLIDNDEFKKLVEDVKTYLSLKKENSLLAQQFQKMVNESESKFRKKLSDAVQAMKKTPEARVKLIHDNYPELTELYPSILTSKRSIYFLTIDKFYLGNSTIVESPYKFIDKKFTEGAIVILDEIDSSKESLLKQQIAESDKYKINAFTLIKHIHDSLASNFPAKMLKEENAKEDKEGRQHISSENAFQSIQKFINGTYQENHLDYFIKLDESFKDKDSAPFVFKDEINFSVKDANKKTIILDVDKNAKYNYIREVGKQPEDKKNLIQVLSSVNGAVNAFLQEAAIISANYMREENVRRSKAGVSLIDPASSASSILKAFGLDRDEINALVYSVTSIATTKKDKEAGDLVYYDFYKYGFCFFTFQDADSNDLMTDVILVQLKETPEYFLYRLVKKAKVLGLAATARIDSPLSNYDIDYLKAKLSDCYYQPNYEDVKSIADDFVNKRQKDNLAKVVATSISDFGLDVDNEDSIRAFAKNYFSDPDLQELLVKAMKTATTRYDLVRFAKIAYAIKRFFLNPKLKTLLVMANRNLDENGYYIYSRKNIEDVLLKGLKAEHQNIRTTKVIPLRSGNFLRYKAEIKAAYRNADKTIVCTTYPSAGIGENLQIEDLDTDENDEDALGEKVDKKKSKDLDAIYVEKPTNVLVNLHNSSAMIETCDLIKAIYQFEVIKLKDGISKADFFTNVRQAVRKTKIVGNGIETAKEGDYYKSLYTKPSVVNASLKMLNQAVGRICRTTEKASDTEVDIYYDCGIAEFDFSIFDDKLVNREFRALADAIKQEKKTKPTNADPDSKVSGDCRNINSKLMSLFYSTSESWKQDQMDDWNKIHEFIAKHPTLSKEEYEKCPFSLRRFYFPFASYGKEKGNRYWFLKKEESGEVNYEIDSFDNVQIKMEKEGNYFEASQEDSSLSALMSIPEIKQYFDGHGIATSFGPNDYILNPIAYQNFYKGILGELAGCFLMKMNGMPLTRITDGAKFEKFDYLYEENNVFIDFKLWGAGTRFGEEAYKKKEFEKMDKVGAKKAVVVSVVSDRHYQYRLYKEGDKSLLTIPSLVVPRASGGYEVNLKFMGILLNFIKH